VWELTPRLNALIYGLVPAFAGGRQPPDDVAAMFASMKGH